MQKKKLGTAVVWMVCLLGMVAVVWSRPPMGSSGSKDHPPLALTEPAPALPAAQRSPATNIPQATVVKPLTTTPKPVSSEPRTLSAGTWIREIGPYKMTIEVKGHGFRVMVAGLLEEEEKNRFECELEGEYHITQDAMFYGIISTGEFHVTDEQPETQFEGDALAAACFYDQPFAFRYRLDEKVLTIKGLKMGRFPEQYEHIAEYVNLVPGRFLSTDPTQTQPEVNKPRQDRQWTYETR